MRAGDVPAVGKKKPSSDGETPSVRNPSSMSEASTKQALHFLEEEKQFHLGFLPTEQSNPLTRDLDARFAAATTDGIACLQRVDRNVLEMAKRVFASSQYARLAGTLLETLRDLFYEIGFAKLTFSTPEEHDRIIAYTSQLAHIASSAYIQSPESQEQMGFSAGSFRDMTRVARLDEDMWTVLMMDNADYLSIQVDILVENLQKYQKALHDMDADALRALLKKGREMKESAGGR